MPAFMDVRAIRQRGPRAWFLHSVTTLMTARALISLSCVNATSIPGKAKFTLLPAPESTRILNAFSAYFNRARNTSLPHPGGAGAAPRGITYACFPCAPGAPDLRSQRKAGAAGTASSPMTG